jgi:hypothetical protein
VKTHGTIAPIAGLQVETEVELQRAKIGCAEIEVARNGSGGKSEWLRVGVASWSGKLEWLGAGIGVVQKMACAEIRVLREEKNRVWLQIGLGPKQQNPLKESEIGY